MTENPAVEYALEHLADELFEVDAEDDEYVLFGSMVLYLHELRETVGDIDVFASRRVYDLLRARRHDWREQRPRVDDPPFLELDGELDRGVPVHVFYDWTKRDNWLDVGQCFELARVVGGWPCIPLELVREHKERAYNASDGPTAPQRKHLADIAILDAHLDDR